MMTGIGKSLNILITGVGGQGTLLACRILGNLGIEAGYDVKASEVHGMSQRGGSVVTHVRIAEKVNSPLVEAGKADFILAFEPLEAARYADYLAPDGCFVINTKKVSPISVLAGEERYPDDAVESIKTRFKNTVTADAAAIAKASGSIRAVNVVLLGIMSSKTDIDEKIWLDSIRANVPAKYLEANLAAFKAGRELWK